MPLDAARLKVVDKLLTGNTAADDPAIKEDVDFVVSEMAKELGADHPLSKDRAALQHFCVARKLNMIEARKMIDAHMAWRAATLPVRLTPAIIAELKKGKIEPYGKDVDGRPIIIVRSGRFDPKERDLDVAVASMLYLLEKTASEYPSSTKVIIFYDRQGFSFRKNWDFDFLKAVAGVLSDNYPEKLAGAYIYPASAILGGLWSLIKPFFEPRTRSKVRAGYSVQASAQRARRRAPIASHSLLSCVADALVCCARCLLRGVLVPQVRIITSDKELLTLIPSEYVPTHAGGTSTHTFDPSMYDALQSEVEGGATGTDAVPIS